MVAVLFTATGLEGDVCVALLSRAAVTEGLTMLEPAGRNRQHQHHKDWKTQDAANCHCIRKQEEQDAKWR